MSERGPAKYFTLWSRWRARKSGHKCPLCPRADGRGSTIAPDSETVDVTPDWIISILFTRSRRADTNRPEPGRVTWGGRKLYWTYKFMTRIKSWSNVSLSLLLSLVRLLREMRVNKCCSYGGGRWERLRGAVARTHARVHVSDVSPLTAHSAAVSCTPLLTTSLT